jgi:uncharacterized repeat protein (TIGR01451 family)
MHAKQGLRTLAVLLGAAVLLGVIPQAEPSTSASAPVVTVHAVTAGSDWARTQPHVAYDPGNDRYFFVWRDKRNDVLENRHDPPVGKCDYYHIGSDCWPNADIYGRLVDGSGVFVSDELPIASDPQRSRDQQWPFAAFNPDKAEYLVAWQEVSPLAQSGGNTDNWFSYCYDIIAQQVDSEGGLLHERVIVSDETDCQWVPAVSYDSLWGDYLVAWHDHRYRPWEPPREYSTDKEIFGQWLAYDGEQVINDGDNFVVTTDLEDPSLPAPAYQQYSAIAYDAASQQHTVFWTDARGIDQSDVFFQPLDHGNTQADDNRPVRELADIQEKPRASYNGASGETWVVWQQYVSGTAEQVVSYAVALARLSADGHIVGDIVTVVSGAAAFWRVQYLLPDVACSGTTGNCLAVWHRGGPEYRLFDSSGTAIDTSSLLHASSGYATYGRAIAAESGDGGSRFVVTFSDEDSIYYAEVPDTPRPPTETPTETPSPTSSATSTPTPTPTSTPEGEPDLTRSYKEASPAVVGPHEEVAFTIVLRNDGPVAADVILVDVPPLPYKAGSAVGGLEWNDMGGNLSWNGTVLAHESRMFTYRVHGYAPPIPCDTLYVNLAEIDDGIHAPFARGASVLANPRPTPTATATDHPTPTATPSSIPSQLYLPMVLRPVKTDIGLTVPR